MSVTNRAAIANRLSPTLKMVLGLEYKEHSKQWSEFLEVCKSEKGFEEVLMASGLGLAPVKQEGAQISISSVRDTYKSVVQHQTIALGHAITEEAIEDDLYTNMGKEGSMMLARSLAQTKEIRAHEMLNNAFDAGSAIADGKALIASDHPLLDGTLDNLITGDLSEAALKSVWVKSQDFKDEAGLRIKVNPRKLIVHPSNYHLAIELTKSDLSTSTAVFGSDGITNTNNINSVKGMFPEGMLTSNYLDDEDAFFVRTDVKNSLILFQRRPIKLKLSYEDPFTGNIIQSASERYSTMAANPRGILGSAGV